MESGHFRKWIAEDRDQKCNIATYESLRGWALDVGSGPRKQARRLSELSDGSRGGERPVIERQPRLFCFHLVSKAQDVVGIPGLSIDLDQSQIL